MKPPADFTILEGITPKLECKATGSPPPKTGQKFDKNNNSEKRERK